MRYNLKGKVKTTIDRTLSKQQKVNGRWVDMKIYRPLYEVDYDGRGFVLKTRSYGEDSNLLQSWELFYHKDGRYLKSVTQITGREVERENRISDYSSLGMIIKTYNLKTGEVEQYQEQELIDYLPQKVKFFDSDGTLNATMTYFRRPDGFQSETNYESHKDGFDYLSKTTYEYLSFDDQGNWTKRVENRRAGDPVFDYKTVTEREIIYY